MWEKLPVNFTKFTFTGTVGLEGSLSYTSLEWLSLRHTCAGTVAARSENKLPTPTSVQVSQSILDSYSPMCGVWFEKISVLQRTISVAHDACPVIRVSGLHTVILMTINF